MAVRYAKREFPELKSFLEAWSGELGQGTLYLTADDLGGEEAAPEIRLDFILPLVGRVGPIRAQVIYRAPDGGVGLRVPEWPAPVRASIQGLIDGVNTIRDYLVERGDVVPADQVELLAQEMAREMAAAMAPRVVVADGAAAGAAPAAPAAKTRAKRVRGLQMPNVASLNPIYEGDLSDRSLRDGLIDIAIKRKTGLLTLVLEGGNRKFGFWSKGGPVGWRSEPLDQEEVLGVLLFKAGQINKEQLQESLALMEENDCRQGEAFIEMGVMTFAQLVMVLQKQCEYVLQRVLREKSGVWAFHEIEELPEPFVNMPLRVPSMLFRVLQDYAAKLNPRQLESVITPRLDKYVQVRGGIEEIMAEIAWTVEERRFIEVLKSRAWRLREIFGVTNMSRKKTAVTLWTMLDLEFLKFQDDEVIDRYLARVRKRIFGKRHHIDGAHLFDVIEVHWISLPGEIDAGYRKMKEQYDAKAYHDLDDKLTTALEEINKALDDAYREIRNPTRRRAYRLEIIEEYMVIQSAELLAKKGEMAIMRGDMREARLCWGKAAELVPNRADFQAGLNRAGV